MDHTAPSWALNVSIRLPEARSYSCSFPVWEERHTRGQISPSAFKTHFRNTSWSVNHICKQTWPSEARKVSQEWQRKTAQSRQEAKCPSYQRWNSSSDQALLTGKKSPCSICGLWAGHSFLKSTSWTLPGLDSSEHKSAPDTHLQNSQFH